MARLDTTRPLFCRASVCFQGLSDRGHHASTAKRHDANDNDQRKKEKKRERKKEKSVGEEVFFLPKSPSASGTRDWISFFF